MKLLAVNEFVPYIAIKGHHTINSLNDLPKDILEEFNNEKELPIAIFKNTFHTYGRWIYDFHEKEPYLYFSKEYEGEHGAFPLTIVMMKWISM